MLRNSSALALIFTLLAAPLSASPHQKLFSAPFNPGERIVYMAEFMSMELARVEFEVVDMIDTLGTTLYHTRARIRSNTRLPLIFVQDEYEAYFDRDLQPYWHVGKGNRKNFAFRLRYDFDHQQKKITGWEYRQTGKEEKLRGSYKAGLGDMVFDCLTVFYYIRSYLKNVMSYRKLRLDIFANGKLRKIELAPKRDTRKVRLVGRELLTFPLDLKLRFKGIAGIRDRIHLAMSADENLIPVSGEIRTVLGKVKFRLVEFQPGKMPYQQAMQRNDAAAPAGR